jgi:hypothetical protein
MADARSRRLAAALDLSTRRLPPSAASTTLEGVLRLLPPGETALAEELCERVEQPLEEAVDPEAVRALCVVVQIDTCPLHTFQLIICFHKSGPALPPDGLQPRR